MSRIFILTFILLFTPCRAQIMIQLPASLSLTVNEKPFPFSVDWTDSLITEAAQGKYCYVIIGASSSPRSVKTTIQIPQILPLSAVYRQVVLYYSMLTDEKSREKEVVNIYPYFHKIDHSPFLTISYKSEGVFTIELKKWERIAVPRPPSLIEREIYNQILQTSFSGVEIFSSLSEEIFNKIALRNGLSIGQIRVIYQNTMLWQQFLHFSERRSGTEN